MYDITGRRECFFDDAFLDTQKTTIEFRLHHPVRKGCVLVHDQPWEGDECGYYNLLNDDGIYRMYYYACTMASQVTEGVRICYAEITDGLHWRKPKLGICDYAGSKENNIILEKSMLFGTPLDNFMVFKDGNPHCPKDKIYKAVARLEQDKTVGLHYLFSADGIHFSYGGLLTKDGMFDSLNVMFWDKFAAKYRCYLRGFHSPGEAGLAKDCAEDNLRDIRYIESADFIHWSSPALLDFGNSDEVSLYTNLIQPYSRADHIFVGFPTRYLFRRSWTENFDELCGKENRKERMKREVRFGQAITDCAFITSRDGFHFRKYDEAFIRPEPECGKNWVYGDCYPARGFIETAADMPGADPELSMFMPEFQWDPNPTQLIRYTLRRDGFVSLHAGADERRIVTKQFVFGGSELYVNFATSALGYMYFTMIDPDGNRYESCEIFGNKTDRRVPFEKEMVKTLSGKPVTLEVRLKDADLYSLIFE